MSNRHDTTTELQVVVLPIDPCTIDKTDIETALRVLDDAPAQQSKWFDRTAVADYQRVITYQLGSLKRKVESDPHSRQIVMYGPVGACWIATHMLSLPDVGYHCIAHYRSMDAEHLQIDAAFQRLLGNRICGTKVEKLTLIVDSYHTYKSTGMNL